MVSSETCDVDGLVSLTIGCMYLWHSSVFHLKMAGNEGLDMPFFFFFPVLAHN